MIINNETIDNLEMLSRLKLNDAEKHRLKTELSQILDYMNKLNELDTSDCEPLAHIGDLRNVLRDDIVSASTDRDILLQNTQSQKNGQFLVPKTVGV